jgi:hypothetical protein
MQQKKSTYEKYHPDLADMYELSRENLLYGKHHKHASKN